MTRVKTAATFAAIALLGLGLSGLDVGAARAGIIVTVGKPNPEPCREKTRPFGRTTQYEPQRTFHSEGTRCVELPGGDVECGKSIRVESAQSLPRDWRCVSVAPGLLWCETPTPLAPVGSAPTAAAGGDYDPTRYQPTSSPTPTFESDPSDQLLAVGCGAGGLSSLLFALGALPLLWLRRRG